MGGWVRSSTNLTAVQGVATRLAIVILAGGLSPENIADALQQVWPFGVDVSSGVETAPGQKDAALVRQFVEIVRATEHSLG